MAEAAEAEVAVEAGEPARAHRARRVSRPALKEVRGRCVPVRSGAGASFQAFGLRDDALRPHGGTDSRGGREGRRRVVVITPNNL